MQTKTYSPCLLSHEYRFFVQENDLTVVGYFVIVNYTCFSRNYTLAVLLHSPITEITVEIIICINDSDKSRNLWFPYFINLLSSIERFFATFHYVYNQFLGALGINTPALHSHFFIHK
jgi:hypothetical protein